MKKFNKGFKKIWDVLKELLDSRSTDFIQKEAFDENDNFMLICFGHLLGFPMPTSFYTFELLPYYAGELEGWERRIINRSSIIGESQLDII